MAVSGNIRAVVRMFAVWQRCVPPCSITIRNLLALGKTRAGLLQKTIGLAASRRPPTDGNNIRNVSFLCNIFLLNTNHRRHDNICTLYFLQKFQGFSISY